MGLVAQLSVPDDEHVVESLGIKVFEELNQLFWLQIVDGFGPYFDKEVVRNVLAVDVLSVVVGHQHELGQFNPGNLNLGLANGARLDLMARVRTLLLVSLLKDGVQHEHDEPSVNQELLKVEGFVLQELADNLEDVCAPSDVFLRSVEHSNEQTNKLQIHNESLSIEATLYHIRYDGEQYLAQSD